MGNQPQPGKVSLRNPAIENPTTLQLEEEQDRRVGESEERVT